MTLKTVVLKTPEDVNIILGHTHFIKSVEDLYEAIVQTAPSMQFGIAFSEASGPALVRYVGNNEELIEMARANILEIGAGHTFLITLRNGFPISILNTIKMVPEVCRIFCATANPVEVVLGESAQGRAVLGVIDGLSPKGVETEEDITARKDLLRKIGYKL
jgi:adenosine/AMP kinase